MFGTMCKGLVGVGNHGIYIYHIIHFMCFVIMSWGEKYKLNCIIMRQNVEKSKIIHACMEWDW